MAWWAHDLTHGLPLLPVLASQAQTAWQEHAGGEFWPKSSVKTGDIMHAKWEPNAYRGKTAHQLPPLVEQHGGSRWLSGHNIKVNCRLVAQHSSNASKAGPSAQAADLVLFNEM